MKNTSITDRLFSLAAAINELHAIDPDNVTLEHVRTTARHACQVYETECGPSPAIEAATAVLWAIDPQPGQATADEPPARCHWLRLAWLQLVRVTSEAAGGDDDDAPRWARMDAGQLADELTYLADFQG
jgi:hypothetical protein